MSRPGQPLTCSHPICAQMLTEVYQAQLCYFSCIYVSIYCFGSKELQLKVLLVQ